MKINIATLKELGYLINTSFNGPGKNVAELTEIRIVGTHEVFTDSAKKSIRRTLAEVGMSEDQTNLILTELSTRVADIHLFNSILGKE